MHAITHGYESEPFSQPVVAGICEIGAIGLFIVFCKLERTFDIELSNSSLFIAALLTKFLNLVFI